MLVTTSDSRGEEDSRWLGVLPLRDGEVCPTGVRRLWYAEDEILAAAHAHDFGPPTPARLLFLTVRQRFPGEERTLGLSATQRKVARLFYLEDRKVEEIARSMGIQPDTVKTHLQRIREKAGPVVGSTLSRRIAAYLQQRPGEVGEES